MGACQGFRNGVGGEREVNVVIDETLATTELFIP